VKTALATTPTTGPGPGLRSRLRHAGGLRQSEWIWGYVFISVNVVGFMCFSFLPVLASLGLAFTDWKLLQGPRFVGFDNILRLFDDRLFLQTLSNSAYFVAGYVPLITVLAFFLAVLLNRPLRGIGLLRGVYFLPSITLLVSVAMVWHWLLDPQAGLINYSLRSLGLPAPEWLASMTWAMPTLIMIGVWQDVGYYAVIYLAGLQGIPSLLYEAAEIDGASWWQKLRYITVPLSSPTTFFVIITSLIAGWQAFAMPFLMTQGGPANTTNTLLLYIYQQAFTSLRMGYASVMAWVLFLLIFAVTLLQWRFLGRGDNVKS
jgi:multiple sugar transport system permease protein